MYRIKSSELSFYKDVYYIYVLPRGYIYMSQSLYIFCKITVLVTYLKRVYSGPTVKKEINQCYKVKFNTNYYFYKTRYQAMSLQTLGKYDRAAIHRNYIHDTQQILYCTRKLALNEPSITKHCFQRLVLNLGYSIWALAKYNDNNYHFIKSIRFIINFIQYIITSVFFNCSWILLQHYIYLWFSMVKIESGREIKIA